MTTSQARVVIISAYHDYRTAKRASIQQVADGFVAAGHKVSFVSTRFSRLSKRKGDSRLFLWDKANRLERVNGVDCYLWRTPLHPFASGSRLLNRLMVPLYAMYARAQDPAVDAMLREATDVVLESSVAAIMLRRIRRLNPTARIIYYATDRLDTVGAHPFVKQRLIADAGLIDHVCLRSPKMVEDFGWAAGKLYRAEFGIDTEAFATVGASPYPPGVKAAVAVGSMLFDASFFAHAAARFPDVAFHVIGCGERFEAPANVTIHDEMPFRDTLPYVKHAAIGIAPYRPAPGVEYLAESSLKLAQYEYLGLPAVCPDFAVGDNPARFGYAPRDAESIAAAVQGALDRGRVSPRQFLTWREVADRVLRPEDYPGIKLG